MSAGPPAWVLHRRLAMSEALTDGGGRCADSPFATADPPKCQISLPVVLKAGMDPTAGPEAAEPVWSDPLSGSVLASHNSRVVGVSVTGNVVRYKVAVPCPVCGVEYVKFDHSPGRPRSTCSTTCAAALRAERARARRARAARNPGFTVDL